jgi:hypothetical protein
MSRLIFDLQKQNYVCLLNLGIEVIDLLNYVLITDEFFLHRWIENDIEGIAVGMTETLSNVILLKHLVEPQYVSFN